MWHWLAMHAGLTDASGPWYLAWSGIVGDLPMFGAAFVICRRLNCHARGCWRVGRHHVDGTHFRVCAKHHPDHDGSKPYTAEQISEHRKEIT